MSSTPRQTQHRASRDGRRVRELVKLKRTQHQLQVEARRLQEALAKANRPRKERDRPAPTSRLHKNACPECGESLHLVDLGRFEMWACPACKYHTKKE